jgi:transposase
LRKSKCKKKVIDLVLYSNQTITKVATKLNMKRSKVHTILGKLDRGILLDEAILGKPKRGRPSKFDYEIEEVIEK